MRIYFEKPEGNLWRNSNFYQLVIEVGSYKYANGKVYYVRLAFLKSHIIFPMFITN